MSPMLAALCGLIISLLLFHAQPVLGTSTWIIGSALATVAMLGVGYGFYRKKTGTALPGVYNLSMAFLLGAAIGWNNTGWQATGRLSDQLSPACESELLWADVLIAELPTNMASGSKWVGEVIHYIPSGHCKALPQRLSLGWYSTFSERKAAPVPHLNVGEVWHLPLKLKRTVAPLQFEGFDVQAYWFEQSIGAVGSVQAKLAKTQAHVVETRQRLGVVIEYLRQYLRAHIEDALQDQPLKAVITALVLGDQKNIEAHQWRLFSATGIGHLVSISGMHITLFAAFAAFLTKCIWQRSTWLCMWVPAPKAAAITGLCLAMFYSLIAGWGVPAQRTVWMLAAVVLGILIQQRPSAVHILGFAAGILLLFDPWAVLGAGFWLSFGAVALLMYTSVGRYSFFKKRYAALREACKAQWVITVGLVPLTVMLFSQLSLISPFANAIAIPWVTFVVTPLAMLGTFTGLHWPLIAAHWAFEKLLLILEPMSQLSWATLPVAGCPLWVGFVSMIGALWILTPYGIPGRYCGWAMLTILWWWPQSGPSEGEVWMEVLDIGQGNAVAIRTRSHTLFYDTGPAPNPQTDSGSRVLIPWLYHHGLKNPDGLIISHQDSDHSGGAASVLAQAPPLWMSSSMEDTHALVQQAKKHQPCRAGNQWNWDGVHFEIFISHRPGLHHLARTQ